MPDFHNFLVALGLTIFGGIVLVGAWLMLRTAFELLVIAAILLAWAFISAGHRIRATWRALTPRRTEP